MTKPPQDSPDKKDVTQTFIDLNSFITQDKVNPLWASGLQVYLVNHGGFQSRTLVEWRKVLAVYQGLK